MSSTIPIDCKYSTPHHKKHWEITEVINEFKNVSKTKAIKNNDITCRLCRLYTGIWSGLPVSTHIRVRQLLHWVLHSLPFNVFLRGWGQVTVIWNGTKVTGQGMGELRSSKAGQRLQVSQLVVQVITNKLKTQILAAWNSSWKREDIGNEWSKEL